MISLPRVALSVIAFLFGTYHGVLGLINISAYSNQQLALLSVYLYLLAIGSVVFVGQTMAIPLWLGYLSLLVTIFVTITMVQLIDFSRDLGYEAWYVGGLGTLLAIMAIRRQRILAISGMSVVTLVTVFWGGFDKFFSIGLIGSWLWVLVAYGSSRAIESSGRAAERYFNSAVESTRLGEIAKLSKAQRKTRIDSTLRVAGPLLEKISRKSGAISESDKTEAKLLEAQLRDEIRGRALIDPGLFTLIRKLRLRGVEVQLLDDGGLEGLDEQERNRIIERISLEISKVKSGKLIIRAVSGESWRVTIVALRKDAEIPDLFVKI